MALRLQLPSNGEFERLTGRQVERLKVPLLSRTPIGGTIERRGRPIEQSVQNKQTWSDWPSRQRRSPKVSFEGHEKTLPQRNCVAKRNESATVAERKEIFFAYFLLYFEQGRDLLDMLGKQLIRW